MHKDEILQEYANRKLIRRYAIIGFITVMALGTAVAKSLVIAPGLRIGVTLLLDLIVIYILWRYWRCPACERMLGQWGRFTHCSHCGTRLEA